jgi:hypothetical protein
VIATAVYVLCMLTSAFCAALLWREYRRSGSRLLLWSGLSFIAWAVNNALVFADFIVVPAVDLAVIRSTVAFVAIALLLYGLIWDAA